MGMKQRFVLLILSALLLASHVVSAQDKPPFVRFNSMLDDPAINIKLGSSNINAAPGIMTHYYAAQPGTQTIELTTSGEDGPITSTEVEFEGGNHYAVILTAADQPPIVINETVAEAESGLAEGENALTIVPSAAGKDKPTFKVLDNLSPTPQERMVYEYDGYLQSAIGKDGVVIQSLDPQTGAVLSSFTIPYFPITDVLVTGGGLVDPSLPVAINYSTTSSVADWLAGMNQMENPPFTFNQFVKSAAAGGFDGALAQCEDYMWLVWPDAAFESQSSANQTYVSGAGAGTILNNSVHEGAITAPWLISPPATRGDTPLIFGDPLAELDNMPLTEGSISGNILMTVSTTGNGVQNVIHVTDTVPLGEAAQTPVHDINLYPSRTSLNLVLPLSGS